MKERQIAVFRAVMTCGGINRASEYLNISQPAVSRMIAQLEQETGLVLFTRSGRVAKPTPEAHQLKREVDTFFIGLERIDEAAKEIRDLRRGHVRMTIMPALTISVAPSIIRQFTSKFPTVKTTLDVHTSPRIVELIGSGQYDLGLGHYSIPRTEIEVLGAWQVDCVCVMAADHPLSIRKVLGPEDLDGEPLIALSYQTDTAQWLDQTFQASGVHPTIRVEAQPSYAACVLAAEGLGIAIIDALTAEFFRSEKIAILPFETKIPFEFKLIRPAEHKPSELTMEFAKFALTELNNNPYTQNSHNF